MSARSILITELYLETKSYAYYEEVACLIAAWSASMKDAPGYPMDPFNQLRRAVEIRRYQPGEEAALQEIYTESTRKLNGKDYTPEQIERWVTHHADLPEWTARLAKKNPFVAVMNGRPVAFGELDPDGHIDCFYCHPDWNGHGAGSELLRAITAEALRLKLDTLKAEVSVTAKPFFLSKGFEIVEERVNTVCNAPAKQFIMSKRIK